MPPCTTFPVSVWAVYCRWDVILPRSQLLSSLCSLQRVPVNIILESVSLPSVSRKPTTNTTPNYCTLSSLCFGALSKKDKFIKC